MKPILFLPPNSTKLGCNVQELTIIKDDKNIVIIGANGSGKSKLGAWIEAKIPEFSTQLNHRPELSQAERESVPTVVHRISAQRGLRIPEYAEKKNFEESQLDFVWGQHNEFSYMRKLDRRWNRQRTTSELYDYDKLLSTLFAQDAMRDKEYVERSRPLVHSQENVLAIPPSNLEILITIWEQIFPETSLLFQDGKIQTTQKGGNPYPGQKMSDGERVSLYLIGQALSVPNDSIIIIDEPEIHLHKSILCQLWDLIEIRREDCRFVYITHDLEFATSRVGARKIWVKNYSTNNSSDELNPPEAFVWEEISQSEGLPEELLLKILGNRQRILFVEGKVKSLDKSLYNALFPDYFIEPRGSWEKVVESVKAFRDNPHLHNQQAFGIIDRDYHSDEQLDQLKKYGIYTLHVAELENFLCIEPIVTHIAQHLGKDPAVIFQEVISNIMDVVKKDLTFHISRVVLARLRNTMGTFTTKARFSQEFIDAFNVYIKGIDVGLLYNNVQNCYKKIIQENNYNGVLKYCCNKGFYDIVCRSLGIEKETYVNVIIKIILTQKDEDFVQKIRNYIPNFE